MERPVPGLRDVLRDPCEGFRVKQGEDHDETVLEIDGAIDAGTVRQLENRIWDHFDAGHQHLRPSRRTSSATSPTG